MTQEQGRVSVGAAVTGISDLKALNEAYRQWASSVRKSLGDINSATSAYNEMEGALRELQRTNKAQSAGATELRSKMRVARDAITEFADATKEAEEAQKAQAKAGSTEQVDKAIEAHNELIATLKTQYTTVEQVEQALAKLSAEIRALQTSESAGTQATRDAITARRQQVAALEQIRAGLVQERNAVESAAAAHDRASRSLGLHIKQILLWAAGSASAYYVFRKLRNEFEQGIKDVYGQSDAYKALTQATTDLRNGLVIAALGGKDFEQSLQRAANLVNSITGFITRSNAAWSASGAELDDVVSHLRSVNSTIADVINWIRKIPPIRIGMEIGVDIARVAEQMGILPDTFGLASAQQAEFNRRMGESTGLIEGARKESTETTSAIKELTSAAIEFSDAQSEAASDATSAWNNYQEKLTDIQKKTTGGGGGGTDLTKQLAKINQNALKQQAKAFADYQRQLADIQRQAQMQEWQMAQQHALDMKFMAQRFRLDQIQSERIYQYSRQQLIAEGDVLAIEDLDARYKLERKAAKENYELQRKQAEAQYALQAEMLRKATEEQIRALKEALAEQLKEQEEARKEQEQEAKETAAQGGGGGGGADIADQMREAHEEYMRQLTEETQAADERTKENARQLAQYALDNNLTVDQVVAIWQKLTGDESPGLKFQTRQAYDAIVKMTQELGTLLANPMNLAGIKAGQQFGKGLTQQLQQDRSNLIRTAQEIAREMANAFNQIFIPGSGGGRGTTPTRPGAPGAPTYPFFQHGGEMIVSQPTMIGVGEHGVTERVVVQPLSPIGGNIGVSWQGGPIQVNGSGFSGADTGAMTGVFNQMLRSFALEFVRQRSVLRGQRGK